MSSNTTSPMRTPQDSFRVNQTTPSPSKGEISAGRDQVQNYQGITLRGLRHFIEDICGGRNQIDQLTIAEVNERFIVPLVTRENKSVVDHLTATIPANKKHTADNCLVISCHSWSANFIEYVDMLDYHLEFRHGYDVMTDRRLPLLSARYRQEKEEEENNQNNIPECIPIWIDCFCINPRYAKHDVKDQSIYWSRAIQTVCQDLSYVLFFLHPWNDVKLMQHIQTYFILYWTTVQSLTFQIVYGSDVDPSFVNAIATSEGVDMLIKMWKIPKDIDNTCLSDNAPVLGSKNLKKMLLTITNWDTIAKKVYMLLRTELRKLGNQLTNEVMNSPLMKSDGKVQTKGKSVGGNDLQLLSVVKGVHMHGDGTNSHHGGGKKSDVKLNDPVERQLVKIDVKVSTAKTLLITVEEAVANDQFKKTKEEINKDRDDIILLLKDIIGACKMLYPKTAASKSSTSKAPQTDESSTSSSSDPKAQGEQLDRVMKYIVEVAMLFMHTRQWEYAIQYLQEGLEHFSTIYNDKHDIAMRCQGNIGVCYHQQGDYLQAEVILQTIHEDYQDCGTLSKVEYYTFAYYLGCLHYDLGKYSVAETLLHETFDKQIALLGKNHTDTLRTMLKLGYLYNIQRKFSNAEDIFRQYLTSSAWIYSKYHKDVINAKQNLANLLLLQWKYDEADAIFQEILDIMKEMYGDLHLNTMEVLVTMGHNYLRQERFQKAEDFYLQALESATKLYGGVDVNKNTNISVKQTETDSTSSDAVKKSRAKSVISCQSHPLIKLYRGYYETSIEQALEFEVMKKQEEHDLERAKMKELLESDNNKQNNNSSGRGFGSLFGQNTSPNKNNGNSPTKKVPKKIKRSGSGTNLTNNSTSSNKSASSDASQESSQSQQSGKDKPNNRDSNQQEHPPMPPRSANSSATCSIM